MDLKRIRELVETCEVEDAGAREAVAERIPRTPQAIDALLAIGIQASRSTIEDPSTAGSLRASTWLLKRLAEEGVDFAARHTTRIVGLLDGDSDDWVQLHLLQLLPYLRLSRRHQDALHAKLLELLTKEHKFVRAWVFNGFGILALADPRWREVALTRFESAMQVEAASVRARIRNVMRELESD